MENYNPLQHNDLLCVLPALTSEEPLVIVRIELIHMFHILYFSINSDYFPLQH
jgi:hypothetical protein